MAITARRAETENGIYWCSNICPAMISGIKSTKDVHNKSMKGSQTSIKRSQMAHKMTIKSSKKGQRGTRGAHMFTKVGKNIHKSEQKGMSLTEKQKYMPKRAHNLYKYQTKT